LFEWLTLVLASILALAYGSHAAKTGALSRQIEFLFGISVGRAEWITVYSLEPLSQGGKHL
jgi:hypothetical protein